MDQATATERRVDTDSALRRLVEGTCAETGTAFFRALVQNLAVVIGTTGAWITEYLAPQKRLRALAFFMDGKWLEGFEHAIAGTACEAVVEDKRLVHIPDRLLDLYPGDPEIRAMGMVSYLGVPLIDHDGRVLGHVAVMDRRPLEPDDRLMALFRLFAERAAAEHRRLAAEARVREREEKLARIIGSAMDAVMDLDAARNITLANAAAERIFGFAPGAMAGRSILDLLSPEGRARLRDVCDDLARSGKTGARWVPGPVSALRRSGEAFMAEATLSHYELRGAVGHTLILRDINDRLEAEKTIRSLAAQTEYLKDELRELHHHDQILGDSDAMRRVLREVAQVAETDATVLILGETGTGKELIARAIHDAGRRRGKPLIRVNCAAIPAQLMESEFFGHEKGAFTGATQRREGRFALADGGTLFLDEVGELPLELQVKLLRALQEGEFEPVGSSRTVEVDVRIIAATNRDLPESIRAGRFREDLFYRLNVFPIRVPPLRERGEDALLLARTFARRAAHRIGRRDVALSERCVARLRTYPWPGNVRELENVIERAVITAENGRTDLDRVLPDLKADRTTEAATPDPVRIRTITELEAFERDNLRRALETCGWRVAGQGGAGELLGINPSTLRSRMKALGVTRPGL